MEFQLEALKEENQTEVMQSSTVHHIEMNDFGGEEDSNSLTRQGYKVKICEHIKCNLKYN